MYFIFFFRTVYEITLLINYYILVIKLFLQVTLHLYQLYYFQIPVISLEATGTPNGIGVLYSQIFGLKMHLCFV